MRAKPFVERQGYTPKRWIGRTCVKIFTEGKSDAKHLEAALKWHQMQGEFKGLSIEFVQEPDSKGGYKPLLTLLHSLQRAGRLCHLH